MAQTTRKDPYLAEIEQILRDAFRLASQSPHDRLAENTTVRLLQAISSSRKTSLATTSSSYLRLIRKILSASRSGMSRNEFLAEIFGELETRWVERRSVFIVQGLYDSIEDRLEDVEVTNIVSGYPQRIEEFKAKVRATTSSRFIHSLLVRKLRFDFDLRTPTSDIQVDYAYNDEFDAIDPENEAWFCCLPLPASEPGEPERVLFAIYPIEGYTTSRLPPGAEQEWDILRLLPEIFALLQHRVRKLKDRIADDQKRLIAEFAPAAITHEMGTSLALIDGSMDSIAPLLDRLLEEIPEEALGDFKEMTLCLKAIQRQVLHARETANAFTNLERRAARTVFSLKSMLLDIERVISRRLTLSGITVKYSVSEELTMETDSRFLGHIVMNVLINAIEAIEPIANAARDNGAVSLPRHMIAIEARSEGANILIAIGNDGPEIPLSIAARAFDRGVTSKPMGVGHGQGLHLCREIARHLGGTFGFGTSPITLPGAKVSFLLTIPRVSVFEGDA